MTKKEIVKAISEECDLTQLKTKEVVQKTFEAIIETLVSEGRIELRNFGVFEVKQRAARKARNPRSGEKVDVPEKFVVTFKPGKEMEEQVLRIKSLNKTGAIPVLGSDSEELEEEAEEMASPSAPTGPAVSQPAFDVYSPGTRG